MSEEPKNQENITPEPTVPPAEEKKSTEEVVTPEELATLRKKAFDFDGLVEKQRLQRLAGKEKTVFKGDAESSIDVDEIMAKVEAKATEVVDTKLREANRSVYETNLSVAYKQWLAKNKWADSDEHINRISEKFQPGTSLTVNELLLQLDKAALEIYPNEFRTALENQARAKVLAEGSTIDTGAGGGTSIPSKVVDTYQPTPEDLRIATKYFNGDVNRYLKSKKKI